MKSTQHIFSFDAETDGLYGPVWAIGAVLISQAGEELARFGGMAEARLVSDPWVIENVVPHVKLADYGTRENLRNEFWKFWERYGIGAIAIADCGSPVESGLFRACIADDPTRIFKGPYPLHEVATVFLFHDLNPDADRIEFLGIAGRGYQKHDPVDDARVSAECFLSLMNY